MKILKEFSKEMETLRPRLGRNVQQVERSKSNGSGSNHAANESKVKSCGVVDDNIQRPDISANGVSIVRSGSIKHYFVPAEDVELSSVVMIDPSTGYAPCEPPCSISSTMANDGDINVHIVTQSSPSPVLSFFEDAPHAVHISHIRSNSRSFDADFCCVGPHDGADYTEGLALLLAFIASIRATGHSNYEYSTYASDMKLIKASAISARLMEDFLELAKDNTEKDLETCGVLGAFLTHPSQSCFMSSIDLHTHYSYQLMLPEAFAVVMAPTDATKNYGIFRLTDPGGTTVLKECPERGFHPHKEPPDGGPLYEECPNVYINPNLRFEIIDLR
ncbi:hypothetical protein ACLOJK_032478 [Asimina triloba]